MSGASESSKERRTSTSKEAKKSAAEGDDKKDDGKKVEATHAAPRFVPEEHGPTMSALLKQYTQRGSLAEVDEDGEHPLFPTSVNLGPRSGGRSRQRPPPAAGGAGGDAEQSGRGSKVARPDIIWSLDRDRWAQLKRQFLIKGRAQNRQEFVALLRGFVTHAEGRDERQVMEQLDDLYTRLSPDEDDGVSWNELSAHIIGQGVVDSTLSKLNIVKVLNHIELDRIAPLRDEFNETGNGNTLVLEQFVMVMKKQFNSLFEITKIFDLDDQDRQLIAQIINLFELIDINGKGTMSWGEFTSFLVDQGMTEDVAREFNIVRFSLSDCRDDTVHQSHIESAFYLERFDKIAYIEQGSKSLKLCTHDFVPFGKPLPFQHTPLCVEYVDRYKYLVVSSHLSMIFYDVDNNLKEVRRFRTKYGQLVMCWCDTGQTLFSADHEGRIFAWDMQEVRKGNSRAYDPGEKEWEYYRKAEIADRDPPMRHVEPDESRLGDSMASPSVSSGRGRGRSTGAKKAMDPSAPNSGGTIVTMLLELPVLAQMASCGVDKNVMIWDVTSGALKQTLRGHEMGVRCMAFAPTQKVLVTGGFDYSLFVWNPYVGSSIHTIQGHAAPIVGIAVLGPSTGQVVSADSEGSLKTWDLGTYQCLQTIAVNQVMTLRAFVSVTPHKRVLAADRKFIAYDYQSTGVADQTDEAPIIKAFYHPRLKVFITGCTTHLRIWDAVTGAIKCVIPHPELTDFCVDDRGRKVFVADHSGQIVVYNSTTGCEIKRLTPHSTEVSRLIFCKGDQNVISVSWDRSIVVHDESEKSPKVWRNATNVHHDDITCVAFSRHLGLIATGSTDCVISIREYERLRLITTLLGHKTDITALAFVEPFHLLVSADFGGYVALWCVPALSGKKHRYDNKVLTRFINMQSLESSALVNCLDPVFDAEKEEFMLYTGDEDGDVRVWDLSRLLSAADLEKCDKKEDWEPHKKAGDIDASHIAAEMAEVAAKDTTPELPIPSDMPPVVRQWKWWKAHTDSIRSLVVYNAPECVVTAGYDHMVKIWTRTGDLMCTLGATNWNFEVKESMAGIDDETLDAVLDKVQDLEDAQRNNMRPRTTKPTFSLHEEVERHNERMRANQQ